MAKLVKTSTSSPLAVIALVAGILGLVLVGVPYVGATIGLIAVVIGLIARAKVPAKRLWIGGVATGAVALVLGLLFTFIISYLIFGNTPTNRTIEQGISQIRAADKDFEATDPIVFGPYDIEVVAVNQNYEPLPSEAARKPREYVDDGPRLTSDRTTTIPDSEAQFVEVILQVRYNGDEAAREAFRTVPSWFDRIELNRTEPSQFEGTLSTILDGEPQELRYVYRIRNSDDLTLVYNTRLFTRVNPIVGTEGMPSEDFQYLIRL